MFGWDDGPPANMDSPEIQPGGPKQTVDLCSLTHGGGFTICHGEGDSNRFVFEIRGAGEATRFCGLFFGLSHLVVRNGSVESPWEITNAIYFALGQWETNIVIAALGRSLGAGDQRYGFVNRRGGILGANFDKVPGGPGHVDPHKKLVN